MRLLVTKSAAHTSDRQSIIFEEVSVTQACHEMVSLITIRHWVSALSPCADTAGNSLTPLIKVRSQISVIWTVVCNDSTTLMWLIKSLQTSHTVIAESIGKAIINVECPQTPTNGLTTAIGRWVADFSANEHRRGSQFSVNKLCRYRCQQFWIQKHFNVFW